jgi:hypothetical protein
MTKTLQEFNRRKIICAVNGSKIICAVNGTENYEEALKKEYAKQGNNTISVPLREYEGEDLTLDRVLLALGELETDVSVCCYGNIRIRHEITNLPRWDLTKSTLKEQSEETQRAIYELLGGENE